jgi:tryptophanyl-tRNA synthetase
MAIVTDSLPLEAPKDPDTCNVYKIYTTIASNEQKQAMRDKYLGGNYGYGHAKSELLGLILEKYATERIKFNQFLEDRALLEQKLRQGAEKAKAIATKTLAEVRSKIGYV